MSARKFADLDIFLSGETIDLSIPTKEYALNSDWYSYFNSPRITKYLDQGGFPNTKDDQLKFWESASKDRFLLVIQTKNSIPKGIISLSSINLYKRNAQIALVVDASVDKRMSPWQSLESICLVTQHAFEVIGLHRITAGQHIELRGWQNRMELAGYRLEGMHKNAFVKGDRVSDSMSISCLYEDFRDICDSRQGRLWDGLENMKRRVKSLPRESMADLLDNFFSQTGSEYYDIIKRI